MNAQTPAHMQHFTTVLDKMTTFEHTRRWLCLAIGIQVAHDRDTQITFDGESMCPNHDLYKNEVVTGNLFARGSDAYADAGSIRAATEAMKFNPLDWALLWHTVSDSEKYDGLSELNTKMSIDLKDLVVNDKVENPLEFLHFKLLGVHIADHLTNSIKVRHDIKYMSVTPFTINPEWMAQVFGPDNFVTMMQRTRRDANEALADRDKRKFVN